jgi:tetratricopeptide (TPR) repeat protein
MSSQPPTQAVDINPNPQTAEDYLQRAWIYLAKKDIFQAEADFNQSLSLNGQLADGYYGLGMIRKIQGESEKAIRAFQEALALIQMDAYLDSPQRGTILRNLCKSQIMMAEEEARPVAS